QGEVVEILERGKQTLVGRFHKERGICYMIEAAARSPHQYAIAARDTGGARDGDMVKAEILEYPTKRRDAQVKVVRVLGAFDDPGMITTLAIESFGLRTEWPRPVEEAAQACGSRVRETDKRGRTDLRSLPLVTIDGADARDFDDAVYAEPAGTGWRVVVAIADVSNYVRKGEPLDVEAVARGTSTYFPDRVVPMLPEELSNGLCSLNPNVDRLCLVCDMQVEPSGKVSGSRFYKGLMRSHARLTYNEVDAAISLEDPAARRKVKAVLPQLEQLYAVYAAFAKARARRGALDLDLPEVVISMTDEHTVSDVAPRPRNDAHRLIEECMIAANVEAARFLAKRRIPGLYRVHPQPDEDRFEELRVMLQELGFKVTAEARTRPRALNKVLRELHERPDFPVLATSVLRTFSQAVYQPENEGHYGLALSAYAHFTSPIRRYPDLLVHRAIVHLLDGGKPGNFQHTPDDMQILGRSCSMLERQAEAASRHVENRYKCLYIREHVGTEMAGVITAVTHFGLFIMLQGLYVEGLVHVTNLSNDYYHMEHGGLRLTGEKTGQSYGLGDEVRVRVTRVDVEEARIDLSLVEADGPPPVPRPGRSRKQRRRR
ncbi:MAG: ribonuclease R, partial [Gammaproteobacteria bacterium]|nr:ribonuclease R [Gammaproteobacteria bacterium]